MLPITVTSMQMQTALSMKEIITTVVHGEIILRHFLQQNKVIKKLPKRRFTLPVTQTLFLMQQLHIIPMLTVCLP